MPYGVPYCATDEQRRMVKAMAGYGVPHEGIADGSHQHLRGHGGQVTAVGFSRDGRRILSRGWGRQGEEVRAWDARSGAALAPDGTAPPAGLFRRGRGQLCRA